MPKIYKGIGTIALLPISHRMGIVRQDKASRQFIIRRNDKKKMNRSSFMLSSTLLKTTLIASRNSLVPDSMRQLKDGCTFMLTFTRACVLRVQKRQISQCVCVTVSVCAKNKFWTVAKGVFSFFEPGTPKNEVTYVMTKLHLPGCTYVASFMTNVLLHY